ncbi:MAG: HEAT repeat domain-containing protein [Armatimonadetes bacterium]|nr:HEAT repeat domain-containing protein [Anaerolineae bacterium]
MSSPEQIAAWIEQLDAPNTEQQAAARFQLAALGEAAIAPLLRAAHTSDEWRIVWNAAVLLAETDDARVFALMCDLLTSSNPLIGQVAAKALARYGQPSLPVLMQALPHCHYMVQLSVVDTLEKLGDSQIIPTLQQLLLTVDSSTLRYTIIQALGHLGNASTVATIQPFLQDPDHHVRKRAGIAIARLTHQSTDH